MENKYIEECLNDLKNLEKKILKIALSDAPKYDYFLNEITTIKQRIFDETEEGLDNQKNLIADIQNLRMEIDVYLVGLTDEIELKFNDGDSGKRKMKRYRIDTYQEIIEVMMQTEEIDRFKLMKVASRWKEEKKNDLAYSAIEINAVEEKLVDVFMKYQLNYIQKNKKLPEENIGEFCALDCYERSLRAKLLQALQTMDKGKVERLELESLFTTGTLEEMLANRHLWKAITGVEVAEPAKLETAVSEKAMKEPEEKNTDLALVPVKSKNQDKLHLRIRKKNIFGKEVEKDVYIEMKEDEVNASQIKKYKKNIVHVNVPMGVKSIGEKAFNGCKNLETINLPDSLMVIKAEAFGECISLEKIYIPVSCETIGKRAFSEDEALEEVNITKLAKLKIIDCAAFYGCTNLERINIPEGCTIIGDGAFGYASSLAEVDMSGVQNLQLIRDGAFEHCEELKEIKIPSSCRKIGRYAFSYAAALEKVDMSEAYNLEEIGRDAFNGCERLVKELQFPEDRMIERLYDGKYVIMKNETSEKNSKSKNGGKALKGENNLQGNNERSRNGLISLDAECELFL